MLGRRPQTLRRWRLEGRGPRYIRIGNGPAARVLYRWADVETWMAARTFTTTSEEV
jgi:hypothetical protein